MKFGKADMLPEEPGVPAHGEHVLAWYYELSGQRRSGFAGVEPIGWSEIADWAALTGEQPTPEEVRMIIAIDGAFRVEARENHKQLTNQPDETNKRPLKRPRSK